MSMGRHASWLWAEVSLGESHVISAQTQIPYSYCAVHTAASLSDSGLQQVGDVQSLAWIRGTPPKTGTEYRTSGLTQ